jgi:N-acyl homoserine lactone hydrolase
MYRTVLRTRLRRAHCARMAVFVAVMLVVALPGRAATTAPDIELWRLDCGEFPGFDIAQMSDTFAYPGRVKTLTDSCYLIRHNNEYMLWDTGCSPRTIKDFNGAAVMRETLLDQLPRIGVDRKQVSIVGISHSHPDHTGQAAQFPQARLLMGKADFDLLAQDKSEDIAPWLTDKANLEEVSGDKDVFGDGSVIMLATPGHTMGHYSLLIRLPKFGPIILSGDLWHFREQVLHNGVPPENVDRAATLASMDRILKAANNLKAKIIIQHEKADIPKLPLFPASAR